MDTTYDNAREAYENTTRGHKRGGYVSRRITQQLNADVTPEAIQARTLDVPVGASVIVGYDNANGLRGRLKGVLTVMDRQTVSTLKVWDADVHQCVIDCLNAKSRVVRIETKPSEKWGDALTRIVSLSKDTDRGITPAPVASMASEPNAADSAVSFCVECDEVGDHTLATEEVEGPHGRQPACQSHYNAAGERGATR